MLSFIILQVEQLSGTIASIDNWYSLIALFLVLFSYIIIHIYFKSKEKKVNSSLISNIEESNTSILSAIQQLNITIVDLKNCIQTSNVNNLDLNNSTELIEEVYLGSMHSIISYVQDEILHRNNINDQNRIVEIDKKLKTTIFTLYVEDYTLLGRFEYKNKPLNMLLTDVYPNEIYNKLMEIIKKIVTKENNIDDINNFLHMYFNSLIRKHQEIITNI